MSCTNFTSELDGTQMFLFFKGLPVILMPSQGWESCPRWSRRLIPSLHSSHTPDFFSSNHRSGRNGQWCWKFPLARTSLLPWPLLLSLPSQGKLETWIIQSSCLVPPLLSLISYNDELKQEPPFQAKCWLHLSVSNIWYNHNTFMKHQMKFFKLINYFY